MDEEKRAIEIADPFARHLMAQYLERREQELTALNSLLADEDFDAIELTAHKLYGSGAAYGLDEISRLGGELENAAKSRESSRVATLIVQLENFVRRLRLA